MPILDDRGRLFGRINLIDAAIALVVLGLIPAGYASWRVFRTPIPAILTATPKALRPGVDGQRVKLTGHHLRPFLSVFIESPENAKTVRTKYLFESPDRAELEVPVLPAGAYDLLLYDETMEIGRVPHALTVVATPPPIITTVTPAVLEFAKEPQRVVLKGERLAAPFKVAIGSAVATYAAQSPTAAEIMVPAMPPGTFDLVISDEVQELARVPKAITVSKPSIDRITPHAIQSDGDPQRIEVKGRHLLQGIRMFVGGKEVTPQFLSLETGEFQLPPMPPGTYDVAVFDPSGGTEYARYKKAITVLPAIVAELQLKVRFIVRPEVLAGVKPTPGVAPSPGAPRLVSYQVGAELPATTRAELKEGQVVIVNGVVRLVAVRKPDGWHSEGQPLKAGAPFILRTENYQLDGEILSIDAPAARSK